VHDLGSVRMVCEKPAMRRVSQGAR
jgi:hypothetical protein